MSLPPWIVRPVEDLIPIAKIIIACAGVIDYRFKAPQGDAERDAMVQLWAECLVNSDVYKYEARRAVTIHYSRSNAFPIMPDDVISIVREMPPTSSPERLAGWVKFWAQYPYSTAIQERTGLEWKIPEPPPEIESKGEWAVYEWHREQFKNWLRENYSEVQRKLVNYQLEHPTFQIER